MQPWNFALPAHLKKPLLLLNNANKQKALRKRSLVTLSIIHFLISKTTSMKESTISSNQSLHSISTTERIRALDIMRGIVLLGILLMNINGFGLVNAYSNPTVSGGATGLNLYTWMTSNLFFEGTMRALFSLLFGIGMFILLNRSKEREAGIAGPDIYFRRLTWMLFFGLVHGYLLLWTGEILYDYALMGFLVYSFRNMAPGKLILIACFLVAVGTLWSNIDHRGNVKMVQDVDIAQSQTAAGIALTTGQTESIKKWEEIQHKKSPAYIKEYTEKMQGDYFTVVKHLAPKNMESDTTWFYKYNLWDILSMMLIGIAFFKWDIFSGKRSYLFYGVMAVSGYLIGISINYYEMQLILENNFSFLAFSQADNTYYLGRLAVAMGHIGAIMLFAKAPGLKWLKFRLAAVGQMALTNYIMHSVICMIVFTGVGFGLFGQLQRYQLLYVVLAIWVFQLVVSPIWLKYFEFGPLEWLWRRLSYLQKPVFKKNPIGKEVVVVQPVISPSFNQ